MSHAYINFCSRISWYIATSLSFSHTIWQDSTAQCLGWFTGSWATADGVADWSHTLGHRWGWCQKESLCIAIAPSLHTIYNFVQLSHDGISSHYASLALHIMISRKQEEKGAVKLPLIRREGEMLHGDTAAVLPLQECQVLTWCSGKSQLTKLKPKGSSEWHLEHLHFFCASAFTYKQEWYRRQKAAMWEY